MDENIINVGMLGGFSIECGGKSAVSEQNSRSKKVLTLLEYILTFRSREVSQAELIDVLWPEGDAEEPANTLKTLLHRARTLLDELGPESGKELIICRRGSYAWSGSRPTVVDCEEFERLYREAGATADEDARLEKLLAAAALYRGDFLPKSTGELWAVPITTYYHSMYLTAVHSAVALLTERARFSEIVELLQRAIAIDPFDEQSHLELIQTLIAAGRQQQAMEHYTHVTELFMNKYGINPSSELTALYKEIVKATKSTEMNLNIIREELEENGQCSGAFFCELEFFKDIYRLSARSVARSGGVVQIALLTCLEASGKKLNSKQTALTMQRLQEVIAASLRVSDVFCRFSVNQYLIMLPSANLEDSELVLRRLGSAFRKEYPHMNVLLHYSALPMEPRL